MFCDCRCNCFLIKTLLYYSATDKFACGLRKFSNGDSDAIGVGALGHTGGLTDKLQKKHIRFPSKASIKKNQTKKKTPFNICNLKLKKRQLDKLICRTKSEKSQLNYITHREFGRQIHVLQNLTSDSSGNLLDTTTNNNKLT